LPCDLYRKWVSVECFQLWLIFLITPADSSYYTLLFCSALHIILIVFDSLLKSCLLTVCEFAAKHTVYVRATLQSWGQSLKLARGDPKGIYKDNIYMKRLTLLT
jgi:hypothetical protein